MRALTLSLKENPPSARQIIYLGIYQKPDEMYEIVSPGLLKQGAELSNRPYFIVRGRVVPNGRKTLEEVVGKINEKNKISKDEAMEVVRSSLPNVFICDSYEAEERISEEFLTQLARRYFT